MIVREKTLPTLYKKSSRGKIMMWAVHIIKDVSGLSLTSVKTTTGDVDTSGKTHEKMYGPTTKQSSFDRACTLMESKWKRKLDREGYFMTVEDAQNYEPPKTPMMLKNLPEEDIMKLQPRYFPCYAQVKLNGVRATYNHDTKNLMSRGLVEFKKLKHIRSSLENHCILTGDSFIDMELYVIGKPVNEIISDVKNGRECVQAWVFDIPSDEIFSDRLKDIDSFKNTNLNESIQFVSTKVFHNAETVKQFYDKAVAAGHEGIVIRQADVGYKWNNKTTRSGVIYKVKPLISAEFKIVHILAEARQANGLPVNLIQYECETDKGLLFKVTPANFGVERRIKLWREYNRGLYKVDDLPPLSITFREWTTTGKPFHPTHVYLRDLM